MGLFLRHYFYLAIAVIAFTILIYEQKSGIMTTKLKSISSEVVYPYSHTFKGHKHVDPQETKKEFYYIGNTAAAESDNRGHSEPEEIATSMESMEIQRQKSKTNQNTISSSSTTTTTTTTPTIGIQIASLTTTTPTPRPDFCKGCFERPYPFIFNSQKVCQSPHNTTIDLLIFIFTTKSRQQRRDAIRETWATHSRNNTNPKFRYVFLVGFSDKESESELLRENEYHQDMAMQQFKDSYRNLTLKTMMGIEWHVKFCSQAKFVMKTDDDVYVNVESVLEVIKRDDLKEKVFGYCNLNAFPMRGSSKWAATIWEYPGSKYPGYCSGTGYVMSGTIAKAIYNISRHVPFFFLEDVYVSLCVDRLGFKLKHVQGFHATFQRRTEGSCGTYSDKDFYSGHEVTPYNMVDAWKSCIQERDNITPIGNGTLNN